jgi:hypothetical protein
MNRKILLYTLTVMSALFIALSGLFAQESAEREAGSDSLKVILRHLEDDIPIGNVNINQDRRIDSLLRKHISYNDSLGISGWKILIYRGRELKTAQDAGAKFAEAFPDLDLNTIVDYQAPDFKTLVGAFRTREEAYKLYQEIKSEFEYSYLVRTTIKTGELK